VIIIRSITIKDIEEVSKITVEAFKIYAENLGLPEKVEGIKETPKTVMEDMGKKRILVAEYKGKIVGAIRYNIIKDGSAYITRFCVDPDCPLKGVGKLLLDEVEQEVMKMGVTHLSLHTALKVKKLADYYYSLGFYCKTFSFERGYKRALLIKELVGEVKVATMV
jgi:ribosomal protein S18 acetylase RimI-like enzyme